MNSLQYCHRCDCWKFLCKCRPSLEESKRILLSGNKLRVSDGTKVDALFVVHEQMMKDLEERSRSEDVIKVTKADYELILRVLELGNPMNVTEVTLFGKPLVIDEH